MRDVRKEEEEEDLSDDEEEFEFFAEALFQAWKKSGTGVEGLEKLFKKPDQNPPVR